MTSQFADDTAVVAHDADHNTAVTKLQSAVAQISDWARKWKIALNDSKSRYAWILLSALITILLQSSKAN